jgi:hypothetical protein
VDSPRVGSSGLEPAVLEGIQSLAAVPSIGLLRGAEQPQIAAATAAGVGRILLGAASRAAHPVDRQSWHRDPLELTQTRKKHKRSGL